MVTNKKPSVVRKMDLMGVVGEVKLNGNALGQNVGPVKLPGKDGGERKESHPTDGRMDRLTVSEEVRSCGSPFLPNIVKVTQNKIGATVIEKEHDDRKEGKRKKEILEKTINREKLEVKVKTTGDLKKHAHLLILSSKNENKNGLSDTVSDGLQRTSKTSSQGGMAILGKRKDIGLNGIYDEQRTASNKLARTTTPTHPLTENERRLEPCKNSAASARPPLNIKLERTFAPDETEMPHMNIIEVDEVYHTDIKTVLRNQSSRKTSRTERKSHVSAKPSHPDTKYHSQVLAVPKLDEWPEFNDQE